MIIKCFYDLRVMKGIGDYYCKPEFDSKTKEMIIKIVDAKRSDGPWLTRRLVAEIFKILMAGRSSVQLSVSLNKDERRKKLGFRD